MIRNYLKIAFRNLKRNKGYAFINVFGLALGIACCVLLFLYVQHELSYDQFHEKADRIYRVVSEQTRSATGETTLTAASPAPLGPALEASFPEVEETVRLAKGTAKVQHEGATFEEDVLFTDSSFFEVFTFPLLKGNPQTALAGPEAVVITERMARTYFDAENPLGRTLSIEVGDDVHDLRVTGVVKTPPSTSSIQFDLIRPFPALVAGYPPRVQEMMLSQWSILLSSTFVLLRNAEQAPALEAKLTSFARDARAAAAENNATSFGPRKTTGLRLQPLADIHTNPEVEPFVLTPPGNPLYAYLLSGVALLVLGLACINFTTLALGRSTGRAKEVGVRKVAGAQRGQIRRQFWGEALLTSGAALFLGLILAHLFLPVFNGLVEKQLRLDLLAQPGTLLFLIGLALVIGLLAGSYPGLVLARFEPTRILRGNPVLGGAAKTSTVTKALVVMQFTLSIALVVGVLVMSAQLRFVQTDLGFNQERIVHLSQIGDNTFAPFRQETLRYDGIERVAGTGYPFFGERPALFFEGRGAGRIEARLLPVSETFLETMGIELVAGRDFSAERRSGGVLVNRAFARAMGWSSAIGKEFSSVEDGVLARRLPTNLRVMGVVENVHARPMHQEIQPLVLVSSDRVIGINSIYVRIAPGQISETLAFLRETWQQVAPGVPFEYQFLDEVVEEAYEAEQRWRAIIRYAAGFALVIACFGLFGLAALAAERRTKEIGIRKVLGASATSITLLLSKDFLKLIGVAFVLAVPIAYFGLQRWLQEFAYRVDLGPRFFLLAGALVALFSLAAVSYQAIRAALADPVDALRYE